MNNIQNIINASAGLAEEDILVSINGDNVSPISGARRLEILFERNESATVVNVSNHEKVEVIKDKFGNIRVKK